MMVSCPKCGFDQPDDRFCAKCGIDMLAFKPQKKPLLTQVLLSPNFHILMILLGAVAMIYYIYMSEQTKQRIQRERARQITKTLSVQEKTPLEDQTAQSQTEHHTSPAELSYSPSTSSSEKQGFVDERNNETLSSPTLSQKGKIHPKLELLFAEVKKQFLEEIFETVETKITYANSSAGLLPRFNELLIEGQRQHSIIILERATQPLPKKDETLEFLKGTQDSILEKEVGFKFNINVGPNIRELTPIQIKILMELKEFQGDEPLIATQTFQEDFEVPLDAAIFFAGTLPHRAPYEDEERPFSATFLKVLSSLDFQKGVTEFVIFLSLKGNPLPQ